MWNPRSVRHLLVFCPIIVFLISHSAGWAQDAYEPDDTWEQAHFVTEGEMRTSHSLPSGDVDWFAFSIDERSLVSWAVVIQGSTYQPTVGFYNSAQEPTGTTGFNRETLRHEKVLTAGTYYVRVDDPGSPDQISDYAVVYVLRAPADSYEFDDTPIEANPIALGQSQEHALDPVTDEDWLSFSVATAGIYALETRGRLGNTALEIHTTDELAQPFLFDYDSGEGLFSRVCARFEPGDYLARVHGLDSGYTVDPYEITFRSVPVAADPYESDNSSATANNLLPYTEESGHTIHDAGDSDWFRFDLDRSRTVSLVCRGILPDLAVSLFDAELSPIATGGGGVNIQLGRGVYFVEVTGPNGIVPDYSITLALPQIRTKHLQQYGLGTLTGAAFLPDGRRALTSGGAGAYLWDVESGQVIRAFTDPLFPVGAMCVSHDGKLIALGKGYSGSRVTIWETETGVKRQDFQPDPLDQLTESLRFSRDDSLLIVGSSYRVMLVDPKSGDVRFTLNPELQGFGGVQDADLSPDGSLIATAGGSGDIILWSAQTGQLVRTLTKYEFTASVACFSPDGSRVLAASHNHPGQDTRAKLFEVATGALLQSYEHEAGIYDACFSPDGSRVATAGIWSWGPTITVRTWDTESGAQIHAFTEHEAQALAVDFSPDGSRVLTASADQASLVFDPDTGDVYRRLLEHQGYVHDLAAPLEGNYIVSASNNSVSQGNPATLYDIRTGGKIDVLSHSSDCLGFSPDGKTVAIASGGLIEMWDTESRTPYPDALGTGFSVRDIAFSSDGAQVLAGGVASKGRMERWDVASSTLLDAYETPGELDSVAFSPDGTRLLAGSAFNIRGIAYLWDAGTTTTYQVLHGHRNGAVALFTPDGQSIVTVGDDAVIWDVATGREVRRLPTVGVSHAAVSPDGSLLCVDGTEGAEIWHLATGTRVAWLRGHAMGVQHVCFAEGGNGILTASNDGTVRLWELNPPRAIIVAGGGDFPGNGIAEQTDDLGAYAYKTLIRRHYEPEDILYLSAFGPTDPANVDRPFRDADGDGLNDVDGWAMLANLQRALTGDAVPNASATIPADFASGAGRLLILMIDHGYKAGGTTAFRLNPTQVLPATTMDAWLDALQTNYAVDVTLVVDCCYSGGFVEAC
ncbi:WD40 repeat domain-containing protein, partial [bacterium]|nr:WD40 repeat domain-containing protein [bacterium]